MAGALLLVGLALSRRHRHALAVLCGAAAFGAATTEVYTAAAVQMDNIGVAGQLDGPALWVVSNIGMLVLLAFPAAIALVGTQLDAGYGRWKAARRAAQNSRESRPR
jgi:hypothetical protein